MALAINIIGPTYARIDLKAWEVRLRAGAREADRSLVASLARCVERFNDGRSIHTMYRPERYWGCAVADLCDGHLLAFHAARAVSS
ncbi:MAG: hypothetical protein HOW73_47540 [Polyangiaceae bacterium]|nr:hypothetical protein [Polyangiaceae bacterium]